MVADCYPEAPVTPESKMWIIGATVGPAAVIAVIAVAAAAICSTKYGDL